MFRGKEFIQGECVIVTLVPNMPKGRKLKLQPHSTQFIDLTHPKEFLEVKLRNFVSLTKGETIEIPKDFGDKKPFKFDVLEIMPD